MKVKLSKYAKMSGVSVRTLWRRIKDGTLKVEYSDTGRVFINVEDEQPFILNVCIYARVSSSENKDNLERQKERLVSYCNAKGYKVSKIITEIGSGLNDERKKLESILTDKSINLIVVEHKDRLSRFGLNYIQKLLELDNRKIEIINPQSNDEDDLMQDFVSIITSFTARIYGRSRSKRLTEKIIKELENQMQEASIKLEFEKAAELRDRIQSIERVSEKQKVSNISENNIDVIGIAKSDIQICIEIFFVRGSKMVGREHYFYTDLKDMENKEILSGFIKQYYLDNPNIPNKIMIRDEIEDKETIEKWLSTILGKKVEIKTPKKGEKLRFVEMAEMNSKVTLENKEKDKSEILLELKDVLSLDKLPRKIETYDISNISGEYMVAGMCVMQDGVIKKNLSRRFKIKTVYNQDDPRCMEEVITRRLKHSIENPKGGFGILPDVIFADGGITQIRATKKAIQKYDLNIPVFGMVKNDKHQTRALMDENRKELKISPRLMNLITNFQDTVHDTAITYHRKLRDKAITKSELDEIDGIGKVKKQALLKAFGSVEKIKQASIEDLINVKGINEELAKKIKNMKN